MKVLLTTIASPLIVAAWVGAGIAQGSVCPPEVATAKAMLNARGGDMLASRSQDVQAPRSQDVQSPRNQDIQSPRSQDTQAPRNQDVQSPRSQDVQAPRNPDVQAPRNQDVQAPRNQSPRSQDPRSTAGSVSATRQAQALVREAEAACRTGNTAEASEKAQAALEIMKH